MGRLDLFFSALATFMLTGCGLTVPNIKEIWDGPRGTEQIEFEIKKEVYCHLKRAVLEAEKIPFYIEDQKSGVRKREQILPDDWGAQISLQLQVDESSAISPGIALTKPLQNAITRFASGSVTSQQSFSFGFGGTVSATATRIDRFDPYYSIAFLRQPERPDSVCRPENDPFRGENPSRSSPFLQSDLGIEKWLAEAMFTNTFLYSVGSLSSPNKDSPDTVGLEIKFAIVSTGNVSPTWKLVRFTGNTSSSLFSTNRTRTHDLIITIGPSKDTKTANTHLASQLQQAITNQNSQFLQIQ